MPPLSRRTPVAAVVVCRMLLLAALAACACAQQSPPPPAWQAVVALTPSSVTCQSSTSPLITMTFNGDACASLIDGNTATAINPTSAKPYTFTFNFATRVYITAFTLHTFGDVAHDPDSMTFECGGTTTAYNGVVSTQTQTFTFAQSLPAAGCTSAVLTVFTVFYYNSYQLQMKEVTFDGYSAGAPPPSPARRPASHSSPSPPSALPPLWCRPAS
jgi:hypothetical protein